MVQACLPYPSSDFYTYIEADQTRFTEEEKGSKLHQSEVSQAITLAPTDKEETEKQRYMPTEKKPMKENSELTTSGLIHPLHRSQPYLSIFHHLPQRIVHNLARPNYVCSVSRPGL